MKLGVNENNEIMAVDVIPKGLKVIEVDDDTFINKNPLLFKIRTGENWQEIFPRVKVQAWEIGLSIKAGDIIAADGGLFEAVKEHTSKDKNDFTPDVTDTLFKSTLPEQKTEYGRKPEKN